MQDLKEALKNLEVWMVISEHMMTLLNSNQSRYLNASYVLIWSITSNIKCLKLPIINILKVINSFENKFTQIQGFLSTGKNTKRL